MKINSLTRAALVAAVSATLAFAGAALAQQPRTLKMQSAVPPSSTTQDAFKFFADRVDKLTGGNLKIDALPGGAVVPPFEILDATHKKVIDGAYGISYWWYGKSVTATLFANTPAGIFGMDAIDFIGWVYEGGGLELWNEFYQKELKLNLVAFPSIPPSPQALGWFKRPIKDLADFKGMKCRQTGIVSQLYAKMGMAVVNMPGARSCPPPSAAPSIAPSGWAASRTCAWACTRSGNTTTRLACTRAPRWPSSRSTRTSGTACRSRTRKPSSRPRRRPSCAGGRASSGRTRTPSTSSSTKHGVKLLTTPPEVNKAFLKTWDEFAAAEAAKNPFFKKVYESQKAYAAKVVPAKRFMFPPYALQADHYWPVKQ